MRFQLLLIGLTMFALQACGGGNAPPTAPSPSSGQAQNRTAAAGSMEEKKNPLDFLKQEQFPEIYNPSGKRDPFKTFEGGDVLISSGTVDKAPLERFELNQLDLTAIVWGIARPKVLFQAPDGYSYIAQVGTGVGRNRGKISKITRNRVLINEEFRDPSGQYVARESEFVMDSDPAAKQEKLFKEMELKYSDE